MLLKIFTKKIISNETEYCSVENPLSMHKTRSNKTAVVLKIPSAINVENVIIAPGQGKKSFYFKQWIL